MVCKDCRRGPLLTEQVERLASVDECREARRRRDNRVEMAKVTPADIDAMTAIADRPWMRLEAERLAGAPTRDFSSSGGRECGGLEGFVKFLQICKILTK